MCLLLAAALYLLSYRTFHFPNDLTIDRLSSIAAPYGAVDLLLLLLASGSLCSTVMNDPFLGESDVVGAVGDRRVVDLCARLDDAEVRAALGRAGRVL